MRPKEKETVDTDIETDEEMKIAREEFIASKEEHHIFGNLSYLGGTMVQLVIQTSHANHPQQLLLGLIRPPLM